MLCPTGRDAAPLPPLYEQGDGKTILEGRRDAAGARTTAFL